MGKPLRTLKKEAEEPQVEIIEVSPELAAEYLQKNQNNRPMSYSRVKDMAAKMKKGEWIFTHQGIAFNVDGIMVDGQHRCAAIIDAGVTVKMTVTWNLQQAAFDHVDTGGTRSGSDLLARRLPGASHHVLLCATSTMMLRGISHSSYRPERVEVVDFAEANHQLILDFINILAKGESKKILRKAAIIASFCNAVRMPDGLTGGHGARDKEHVQLIAINLTEQKWVDCPQMKTLFNRLLKDELDARKYGHFPDALSQYALVTAALRATLNGKSYLTAQSSDTEWGYQGDLVKTGTGVIVRGRPQRE